jgi:hypothetical protein
MKLLSVFGIVLAIAGATGPAAQDIVDTKECAQPSDETQRAQIVMTLIRLRYQELQGLESSLRSGESEETELRGSIAKNRALLATLKGAGRDELAAVLSGLEERALGVRARNNNTRGQLAIQRHEVGQLERLVRSLVDKAS